MYCDHLTNLIFWFVWNSNLMIPDFPIDIRIRLVELIFFLLLPAFANFQPSLLAQFCWDSQQGRELANSGSIKTNFQFCQSYYHVNRKVWYRQIWIPDNLGFIVLILTYRYILIPIFQELHFCFTDPFWFLKFWKCAWPLSFFVMNKK